MQANQQTFRNKKINDLPVEVCIDGQWICGTAKDYVGRVNARRKARVILEDGQSVNVHLGKVVLRDGDNSESDGSGSEGNKKRRRRSRSRRRNSSPDWSRYKGRSETELAEEFREKSKEDAVCAGHTKSYGRRPLTMEEELWKKDGDSKVSMLGPDGKAHSGTRRSGGPSAEDSELTLKLRREDELERQKRMRDIYEKYGSATSAAKKSASSSDIDMPDVLRLG